MKTCKNQWVQPVKGDFEITITSVSKVCKNYTNLKTKLFVVISQSLMFYKVHKTTNPKSGYVVYCPTMDPGINTRATLTERYTKKVTIIKDFMKKL